MHEKRKICCCVTNCQQPNNWREIVFIFFSPRCVSTCINSYYMCSLLIVSVSLKFPLKRCECDLAIIWNCYWLKHHYSMKCINWLQASSNFLIKSMLHNYVRNAMLAGRKQIYLVNIIPNVRKVVEHQHKILTKT